MLRGQRQAHGFIGRLAAGTVGALGGGDAVQVFIAELAASLPLPWDAKVTATARGLQITGILLCVTNGHDLTTCYCFTDLAHAETKTAIKNLLTAAINDWTALAQ